MIYIGYAIIGLGIFYLGFWVGREEMKFNMSHQMQSYYEQKLRAEQSRRHITQPPKQANYEAEYHDIHGAQFRARIFPN